VNWAYDQDSTPQSLSQKNDDGHTKLWNAAGPKGKFLKPATAAAEESPNFFGGPKFFAHATGWVNDYSVGRAKANGQRESSGLSVVSQTAQTTMLAQEDLWNAAKNDEITVQTVGHLHPSEMTELQKLSPEYRHEITSEKEMDYHPMKWMKHQRDPSAIKRPTRGSKLKTKKSELAQRGIFEKLWNAAADDEIGGDPSADEPGHLQFKPRKWLRNQQDEAEMAELHPRHGKRMFGSVQDHEQNYDGAFVNDNSIGVHVSLHLQESLFSCLRRDSDFLCPQIGKL
jgi:hypothetical protein